jgi:alpha-L-fucosidase
MRNNQTERKKNSQRDMRKYAAYMRHQVEELLTRFGDVDIIWFDFSFKGEDGKGRDDWESETLYSLVRKLRPDILVDNRLDLPGSGDFVTPEQYQPRRRPLDGKKPAVWEACQTFSGSWGYYRDEHCWREPDELLRTLIDCVSKDGNLLLNVGPTARGEFDARVQDRLGKIGSWMRQHGRAIYGCGAAPAKFACPKGCALTYNAEARRLYVHILEWPYKHLYLDGLHGKVKYAQLLHDASQVAMKGPEPWQCAPEDAKSLCVTLPQNKPAVAIPVLELFL